MHMVRVQLACGFVAGVRRRSDGLRTALLSVSTPATNAGEQFELPTFSGTSPMGFANSDSLDRGFGKKVDKVTFKLS